MHGIYQWQYCITLSNIAQEAGTVWFVSCRLNELHNSLYILAQVGSKMFKNGMWNV